MKCLACFLIFAGVWASHAQQYQGASEALRKVEEAKAKKTGPQFQQTLKDFEKRSRSMPPKAAAAEWMKLMSQGTKRPSMQEGWSMFEAGQVFSVLPPPEAWPDIEKIAAARVAAGNRTKNDHLILLSAQVLQANVAGEWKSLETLLAMKQPRGGDSSGILSLYSQLAESTRDPVRLERALRMELKSPQASVIEIPDVAGVLGNAKAAVLLRDLIVAKPVKLSATSGKATAALARQVAIQNIAKMKHAQWDLALSTDAAALYEALQKRFPAPAKAPRVSHDGIDPRDVARVYYVVGMIVHGRPEQAASIVVKYKGQPFTGGAARTITYELVQAGQAESLYKFFSQLLTKHPELPLWTEYISVATYTGRADNLVATLRKGLAQPKLQASERKAIEDRLGTALLAAGHIEEGVALLRRRMMTPMGEEANSGFIAYRGGGDALTLAKIGHLLNRKEWVEEGLAVALKQAKKPSSYGGSSEIAEFLIEIGRPVEAENLLIEDLVTASRPNESMGGYVVEGSSTLLALASLYERVGRHEDVVKLLDASAGWGVGDIVDIYTTTDPAGRPFGYVAASSLAATGQKQTAGRIAEAVMRAVPGYDLTYRLYVDIRGDEAIPVFESLYALDKFEERPLIWIAEAHRRSGRLDVAEKTARQAIQVDPSDGEQHLGTRLMAYTVLADIRDAKGAAEEAAQLRGAVKAIRHSERADKFLSAGLQTHSIKMYKESLDMFQNAYCIQSRLAVTLASEGRYDEAAEHYRKAYELMPDSFGRVETHCLGCERAFDGELAQSIAEKVFTDLIAKTPEKPQVHYLMGYLREDEGRYAEAARHYRKAVDLDPEYLNAWMRLASMADHGVITVAEREKATLQLHKLDPQRKHTAAEATDIRDLKSLWRTLDASLSKLPPVPDALYPLAASRASVQSGPASGIIEYRRSGMRGMGDGQPLRSASEAIARTKVIHAIGQMIAVGMYQG